MHENWKIIEKRRRWILLYTKYKTGHRKGGNKGSLATAKNVDRILNHHSLPLRQVSDLTGSHQQVVSLLSGLFLSSLLLLTSDSSSKGGRNGTTGHNNQTNIDGGVGRGNIAPSAGAEDASTVLKILLEDGGEVETPCAPRFEIVATGVSIHPHLSAARVNTVFDLIAEGETAGLEGNASYYAS
jgi:hypothetical protein